MRKAIISAGIAALALAQLTISGIPGTMAAIVDTSLPATGQVVLIAQNEELDVFDIDKGQLRAEPLVKKSDWVNGPPCFLPLDSAHHFVEADDNPSEVGTDGVPFDGENIPFFGVFKNNGSRDFTSPYGLNQGRIGAEVRITRTDDNGNPVLTPMEDPAGCTFDPATKNFFGVDVGYNHDPGAGDGALIEFFYDPLATRHYARYCILDAHLSQPGTPAFDNNTLYLPETGGGTIWQYTNLPASTCDTGALGKTQWSTAATNGIATPSAIIRNPATNGGGWAVSSVLGPGAIYQLTDQGTVVRPLVTPGTDTGAPFGFGIDKNNSVFYADLGLKVLPNATSGGDPTDPLADAEDGRGALRWIKGGIGAPIPRALVTGWSYPDGVAIVPADWISQKDTSVVNCDWATFGHDLSRSFAPLGACSSLDAGNVATLGLKWYYPTVAPVTAQPIVVKDPSTGLATLYVGASDGTFYALDHLDRPLPNKKWTFNVKDPNVGDYGVIPSSAAVTTVWGQRVVIFAGAATLYVLNADNGALLTALCFDPKDGTEHECDVANGNTVEIESSPAVVPDGPNGARIFVGMDYNEDENVGRAGLVAVRLSKDARGWHLKPQWKYDPEALATYTASSTVNPLTVNAGNGAGCGNVWSSPAVDTVRQLVVFGVGNCDPQSQARPQVNGTWIEEAIVGVRYDGSPVFRYAPHGLTSDQSDPDLDFGATPNLMIDGTVGEAGKDGCYHALTPAGLLAWPHDPACVATPSDIGGMIGSTALGMANGQPAVFAASAIPFSTRDPQSSFEQNTSTPNTAFGLHAIRTSGSSLVDENNTDDPSDDGTVQWDAPAPPAYGAVVYTGNMVLVPDTFGMSMQAYDADTGRLLWSYPLQGAPASPPTLYGDSMYFGSGTPSAEEPPLNYVGGIWGFALPAIG